MTLESEVRERLSALLAPRDTAVPRRVMGAGSDDIDSGRRYLRRLADGGFAVPDWPVSHGGMGLDADSAQIVRHVLDEFAAPDLYPFLVGLGLIGPTLLVHATDDQLARWLPRIRSGEDIWCQMFSEPQAGSDLAALTTKAERTGDGWIVNGSKVWTSRAHYAQRALLLARSDPSVPKHAGITAFGLDMAVPGITVRPLVQMNGDSHFNEVFLRDVRIADSDRIGAPGDGWRVAITCLSAERSSLAGDLGLSYEKIAGLKDKVAGDGIRRQRLVRALIQSRVNQWSAQLPGAHGSVAKLIANGVVREATELAMELDGMASTVGPPDEWQSAFLVSPSLGIRGGTDEIQRNIIGERLLGLPPEPRVDRAR